MNESPNHLFFAEFRLTISRRYKRLHFTKPYTLFKCRHISIRFLCAALLRSLASLVPPTSHFPQISVDSTLINTHIMFHVLSNDSELLENYFGDRRKKMERMAFEDTQNYPSLQMLRWISIYWLFDQSCSKCQYKLFCEVTILFD